MANFTYEAIDKSGNILNGIVPAENEELAALKLKDLGYIPIELRPQKERGDKAISPFTQKKVTIGDKTIFSRQLATMINAGIPITRALFVLSDQSENPTLKKALETIASNVEGGISISKAFSEFPAIFDQMYLGMIRAGEVGGTLGDTLIRLSD